VNCLVLLCGHDGICCVQLRLITDTVGVFHFAPPVSQVRTDFTVSPTVLLPAMDELRERIHSGPRLTEAFGVPGVFSIQCSALISTLAVPSVPPSHEIQSSVPDRTVRLLSAESAIGRSACPLSYPNPNMMRDRSKSSRFPEACVHRAKTVHAFEQLNVPCRGKRRLTMK